MTGVGTIGRANIWGLGSDMDTKSLIDLEMQMLKIKDDPYRIRKDNFEGEKEIWTNFKTSLNSFSAVTDKLKKFGENAQNVSTNIDGFAKITSDGKAISGNYKIEIQQIGSTHKVLGKQFDDPKAALNIEGTVKINEKEVTISKNMSIEDVAKEINNGKTGAKAVVIGGALVLTAEKEGAQGQMKFEDANGVFESLGILKNGAIQNEVSKAQNAKLTVDGIAIESASNSVTTAIPNTTIELTKETEAGKPISLTIKDKPEDLKAAVKEYVTEYNKLVSYLNALTGEGGGLRGKTVPNKLKSELSRELSTANGSGQMMIDIGISLDGVAKNGKIQLDEKKFLEKLQSDPEKVKELLSGDNGLGGRIAKKIDEYIGKEGTVTNSITALDKQIKKIDDYLLNAESIYETQRKSIEARYAKFESLMMKLKFGGDMLEAQLKGLNGSKDD